MPEEKAKMEWRKPLTGDTDRALLRVGKMTFTKSFDFDGKTCDSAGSNI